MRNGLSSALLTAAGALAFTAAASAQNIQRPNQVEQHPPSVFDKMGKEGGGGPAPVHDMSGSWAGPLEPQLGEMPPITPAGAAKMKFNVPDPFSEKTTDPWKTCDPFGFPRSTSNETRGLAFGTMPGRILILTQYQKVWREVWMDGRALPKNVDTKGGPDPRVYGFSVGHWEDDNTLVVETSGVDDKTWLDRRGYPHTVNMVVTERYHRIDHNNLELTVTVNDPAYYSHPFVLATNKFKWIPNQEDSEQLCIPSEAIAYYNAVAIPAGQDETDDAATKDQDKAKKK